MESSYFETPNPQVLGVADQFRDAYDQLKIKAVPGAGLLLPLLHCGSIAIELYLKSLGSHDDYAPDSSGVGRIVHANPPSRTHDLVPLLEHIPAIVRKNLRDRFRKEADGVLNNHLHAIEGVFLWSRYPFSRETRQRDGQVKNVDSMLRFLATFSHETETRSYPRPQAMARRRSKK